MRNNLHIVRQATASTLILIVLLSLIGAVGCKFDDPEALQKAKEKFSVREFTTYDCDVRTARGRRASGRHKIFLVKENMSRTDLLSMARLLHKAYPDTSFDFFDDESQVSEYAEWSVQNGCSGDLFRGSPLKSYIYKHRVAEVTVQNDVNRNKKWFLVYDDRSKREEL